DAIVALLRSPHFRFADDAGVELSRASISALDRCLSEQRYLGDPSRLPAVQPSALGVPALAKAIAIAGQLQPLTTPASAARHLRTLVAWWQGRLRDTDDGRERRARAAVAGTLQSLAAVHEQYDDPEWTIEDLALAVRQWLEGRTFAPEGPENNVVGDGGVHLLDDRAARYGDFDDVTVVGLVEPEWPERPRRNIFYPPALLKALGWPSERDRQSAADAQFLDLIASASRRTALSIFLLDD